MQAATLADLEKFQTDALFVLVGQNPLPNYVAARLLLKKGGRLYLIHSQGPDGSGPVAQRLCAQLRDYRCRLVGVDPLDSHNIRSKLQAPLQEAGRGPLGLNYTGGTKMMAVHTYRALEQFGRDQDWEPVFSYLDADSLSLSVEPRYGTPPFCRQVVNCVEMSLQEILDLHDIRPKNALQSEPQLPELARALASQHKTEDGAKDWRSARNVLLGGGQTWAAVKAWMENRGLSPDVIGHLEAGLGLEDGEPVRLDAAGQHSGLGNDLRNWLEGTWLEDWVLTCLRELGYQQRTRGLEGYLPDPQQGTRRSDRYFEIDALAIRGYQLFGFSCTLKKDEAKLKFLEVFTRARQIGGEEARVALVAPLEDPDRMQQQIKYDWEGARRVRVFGCRHLPDLGRHIQAWFDSLYK
jgi:hypothetical protein